MSTHVTASPSKSAQDMTSSFKPALSAAACNRSLPLNGIHRILVCRTSHTLGNTLLLTPFLHELEKIYPGAEVDVVTRFGPGSELYGKFTRVKRIYFIPRKGYPAFRGTAQTLRDIRGVNYDLAIDPGIPSNSDRYLVMGARARFKLGYRNKSHGLTHSVVKPDATHHVGKVPVDLLRLATGTSLRTRYPPLSIRLNESERLWGREALLACSRDSRRTVGVFTSATGRKALDPSWWRDFLDEYERSFPDDVLVEIVPLNGRALLEDRVPTYFSSDLRRLASVLSALSVFVTADCGVMHLACASGVATIGLFRGTCIEEWGPYGENNIAIDVPKRSLADVVLVTGCVAPSRAEEVADGVRAELEGSFQCVSHRRQ